MISQETSRSGLPALRWNGRWLASSVDPLREAVTWAKKVAAEAGAGDLCVIGAGCGYHVDELMKLVPDVRIVVVEPVSEVAGWVLSQFPHFSSSGRMEFLIGNDPARELERWCETLSGVGSVIMHGPTTQLHPEWSREMRRFILARDRDSLLAQVRARPELLALLDTEKIGALAGTTADSAVSIKTLMKLFNEAPTDSQERRLWRVLEELVN